MEKGVMWIVGGLLSCAFAHVALGALGLNGVIAGVAQAGHDLIYGASASVPALKTVFASAAGNLPFIDACCAPFDVTAPAALPALLPAAPSLPSVPVGDMPTLALPG